MADAATLSLAFMRSHPAEAARILETVPAAELVELLVRVPARIGGAVLREMLPRTSARAVRALPEERGIELLTELGTQPAVAVLRHIEDPMCARLIAGLPTAAALAAKLLLEYIDDSVGACMDPSVVALPASARVSDALVRVRTAKSRLEWVFGVDEHLHLVGWVSLALLVRAPESASLDTLLLQPPGRLAAQASLAGALAHPAWQLASTLPVLDRSNRLIGVLTRDALDRAIRGWTQRHEHARTSHDSLVGVLVHGYWQGFSGILQLLTAGLPAVRPISGRDHER